MTRPGGITITDHCLLRYLERVAGIDVGAIRRDLIEASGVDPGERWLLNVAAHRHSISLDGLRAHVARTVRAGMDAGAVALIKDGYRYVLAPHTRAVITIAPASHGGDQ